MLRRATTKAPWGGLPPSPGIRPIPRTPSIDAAAGALGRRRGRAAIAGIHSTAPLRPLWRAGGGAGPAQQQLQQARAMSTHARIQLREIRVGLRFAFWG